VHYLTPLPEESSRLASLLNEMTTYQSEMFIKFVTGQEPLDKFDEYVEQLKNWFTGNFEDI
jgi:putative aldouronate transport system substrate-binding protein